MDPDTQITEVNSKISTCSSLMRSAPDEARILIVCDDSSIMEQLRSVLFEAGLISECVHSVTEGCTAARSGQFQVVFCKPFLGHGSWKRLVDVARHYDLGFEVVLVAGTFHFSDWDEALEDGAFDVLEAPHELSKAAESARRALWAAYLKGLGPCPAPASLPTAA